MFTFRGFKRLIVRNGQFLRHKHAQDHWSVQQKKNQPSDKALAHFDDFYKQVFTHAWEGIREGLLSSQKYVAVVNNYADNEETMAKFELQGAMNVRTLFKVEKENMSARARKKARQRSLQEAWDSDESLPEDPEQVKVNHSLESSLRVAELDNRRIIDSKNELSSESLHEFIPASRIKGREDFVPESTHYQYYGGVNKFGVRIDKEFDLNFPEHLNVYCFEEGNFSSFDPSRNGATGVLNYYLMDGASIMPVLALDLKPGVRVLDLCAAPGGKSLLAIQTLYPSCVVSNDISMSRTNRIYSVFRQFLYDLDERWLDTGRLKITRTDARFMTADKFDRILVDVPCTIDRHSLRENNNNIFKPSRIKERLQLPELQCELLVNALKLINKGGIVVYSTCSLSPIQNDGVVHMALKKIWEETKIEMAVKDLSPALVQTRNVFKLGNTKLMKYGHLILPKVNQNYGPMYFCKLERVK